MTALRDAGRGRVAVDLDGRAWRVLPAEAVLAAGLGVGVELDRQRARELRRRLRRAEALAVALGALRHRDHTRVSLAERLERRGVSEMEREDAVSTLARAGLVDDRRFAHGRAAVLAARGAGDLLIRDDLERRGIAAELVEAAVEGLEPELERARRILAGQSRTARTVRRLVAKGFAADSLEAVIADLDDAELR